MEAELQVEYVMIGDRKTKEPVHWFIRADSLARIWHQVRAGRQWAARADTPAAVPATACVGVLAAVAKGTPLVCTHAHVQHLRVRPCLPISSSISAMQS